uniref:SGNH hydrolase-type esterase domain-containing protein n=1 Tax=Amphiprion ocellaris TaxID=80972 RepID=A0AAQ5Z7Y0_AMPOC
MADTARDSSPDTTSLSAPPHTSELDAANTTIIQQQIQRSQTRISSATSRRRLLRDAVRRHSAGSVGKDLDHHGSCLQPEFVDSSSPRFHRSTITSTLTDTEPQGQLAPAAAPLHTSPDATSAGSPPRHLSRKFTTSRPPLAPLFAPSTLIIGDSIMRGIRFFNAITLSFPGATAADIAVKIPSVLRSLPSSVHRIILHVGCNDTARPQSEQTKRDFQNLTDLLKDCGKSIFISGPLPTVNNNSERFSRLLSLNTWISSFCRASRINFIDNFNCFWNRPEYFNSDGIHPNRSGRSLLISNIQYTVHTSD